MKANEAKKISKYLSLVLRHQPGIINLTVDAGGWADVDELIEKSKSLDLNLEKLRYIVENNDKKRFSFSSDLNKIRANQGHSIQVDLGLIAIPPPDMLYHGTAISNMDSIKEKGIIKGRRHHVHLSAEEETARSVGMRYGKPVVLKINAKQMHQDGIAFFQSTNGVWLTDTVPTKYIVNFS